MNSLAACINSLKKETSPPLLALSGGPDSMALFHYLLQEGIRFAAAHVDHRAREESASQAKWLNLFCQRHEVPFFLHTLEKGDEKENLENRWRRERLHFFSRLIEQKGFSTLLLAHHQDDQAETILKRIFEGASFRACKGMTHFSVIDGVKIMRPFLSLTKRQIMKKLKAPYIQDETNFDGSNQRSRIRMSIVPLLYDLFGKDPSAPLCRLGCDLGDFHDYLSQKCADKLSSILRGKLFSSCDFRGVDHKLEIYFLIEEFLSKESIFLSRKEKDAMVFLLQEKKAFKRMRETLYIDRGMLYSISKKMQKWKCLEYESMAPQKSCLGLEHLCKGHLKMVLPKGRYSLSNEYSKKMNSLLTKCKVPAFFKPLVPVVCLEGVPKYEFLSGKEPIKQNDFGPFHVIELIDEQ